ncbi:2283_t:CDS:2 [Gigaspora margarita]|uniref:2283_t:CDS:1 n=1 Tax=Gigaspora margarita TaxID=4874 RepID=A0ABN7UNR1_GIGMA|nr:2283_t:CDS:2 [Gigaspora margarita]
MADFTDIFKPFINLFSHEQLQAVLLAWIPLKLKLYFSEIIAVDMFITTLIATAITTFLYALCYLLQGFQFRRPLIVQIEYYIKGIYGTQEKNQIYEALSWIISQQTKELDKGSFIVQPTNSKTYELYEVPDFNILPEKKEPMTVEYKGRKFNVVYKMQETDKNNNNNSQPVPYYKKPSDPMPSIYLSIINNDFSPNRFDVKAITEFINEVMHFYFKTKKKHHKHSRYKRNDGNWNRVQYLSDLNGLETVVLDESQEILLKKELDSFVNDKEFYQKSGVPYRCGFLLYGKPGTGKTSLIYAISSALSRDLYYLNLKEIKNNNDMSAVFSSVPPNQIIVLEDVDAQSNILYKRDISPNYFNFISEDVLKEKDDLSKYKELFSFISLSNFLGCLDGQILSEGTIIIMTTNQIEHLDPACICPCCMDVHMNLEYCMHYQIRNMYKKIKPNAEFSDNILKKIPERSLPLCDVVITMMSYRNESELIPGKILELVEKYHQSNSLKIFNEIIRSET